MFEITALLLCVKPVLNRTLLNQLTVIIEAVLCLQGRVTMLGISRWSDKGGSYRTIQRFYNSVIPWCRIQYLFIRQHLLDPDDIILLAGDETTVTKAGKMTYGLGRFFSSIYSRAVPGLGFFCLSFISVNRRKAFPVLMEQLDPDMQRNTKTKTEKPKKNRKGKPGRPAGSKNKNRKKIELTPYLLWIQGFIRYILKLCGGDVHLKYFLYDGAFGNNACLQTVKQCGLHIISKLHCNAALYFPYEGEYGGRGPRRKYGDKLNYSDIPAKYLSGSYTADGILTKIYQMTMLHKDFSEKLNITVIQKINISNGKESHAVLFSDDLELTSENMIFYYRLRFQIEFTFRDAKQHWGLEDFMNIKKQAVRNAANLSMFMVNLSYAVGRTMSSFSVNDIKARFHAHFYVKKLLKKALQIEDPIIIQQLYDTVGGLGCIHKETASA